MNEQSQRRLWIVAGILLAVGIAIRVHNAFHYRMAWGFDAKFNWQYVQMLLKSWTLPAPDAGWSTAHPPFFYYASAAVSTWMGNPGRGPSIIAVRLLSSLIGLVTVWLSVLLVRRTDPENLPRALLAGGLVLFLPVHIYMSAMFSEEILCATLISLVVVAVALEASGYASATHPLRRGAVLGFVAGLAFLTKLTGVLVLLASTGTVLLDGWRRQILPSLLPRLAVFVALTALVGGWYYVHNLVQYGYLYPHGLPAHQVMFSMPPGERMLLDYFRFPLATFTDPQLLNPDLLRSIWGSTYVTMWFDGHRHFLPIDTPAVTRVGTAILLLALVPTAAFAFGALRGVRRALRTSRTPDTILLALLGLTLVGYVLFTWKNPWYAVNKASFMLGLCVPFSYYASEVLEEWLRFGGRRAALVAASLVCLVVLISASFTYSNVFWNTDHMRKPGVDWRSAVVVDAIEAAEDE